MSQSRVLSAVEATTNVLIGWVAALATQAAVFPAVGLQVMIWQHITIGCAFTAVSFTRSYVLRRLFERLV